MLKMLGAVLIFGACSAFGLSAKQRLYLRLRALEAMISALDYISSELKCCLTPIPVLIQTLAGADNRLTAAVFGRLQKKMNTEDGLSLPYKWCKAFQEMQHELGLHDEEMQMLCDVSSFLGKYDAAQQIKSLDYVAAKLNRVRDAALGEAKRNGNLYRTCGIAVGVIAVLILL